MNPATGSQTFSSVVELIYDTVLNQQTWPDALRLWAQLMDAAGASVAITQLATAQTSVYEHGIDHKYLRSYLNGRTNSSSPRATATGSHQPGSFLRLKTDQEETIFFNELRRRGAQMSGFRDSISIPVMQSQAHAASISIGRSLIQPEFSDRDVHVMQLLGPHIHRALAMADALHFQSIRAQQLEAALEPLSDGVLIATATGRILYANTIADQYLAGRPNEDGDLGQSPTDEGTQISSVLYRDLRDSFSASPSRLKDVHTLVCPTSEHGSMLAHVLPLSGPRRDYSDHPTASYAVFICNPKLQFAPSLKALAQLFHLSAAELRVLRGLLDENDLKEVASTMGLKLPTVKTHLQRIFEKVTVSRQADLLKVIYQLTRPGIRGD